MKLDPEVEGEPGDETIGLRHAASVLGVHPNTLRNWGARGKLRELRVGSRGDRRYYRSDVEAIKAKLVSEQEERAKVIPDQSTGLAAVYDSGLGDLMASYQAAQSMFARNYGYVAELARAMSAVTFAAKHIAPMTEMVSRMLLPTSSVLASAVAAKRDFVSSPGILAAVAAKRDFVSSPGILAMVAAQRDLLSQPAILALFSQQQKMASVMVEMTRAFQPRYAAQLTAAIVPAGRALASVNEIAKAAGGASLAVQRASAILTSFRGFTDGVAERLPSADISDGESGLAVGQLDVGSEVLESGVGSLRGLVELGPVPAVDDQLVLNVFDAILIEVDRRRTKLILLPPNEIVDELNQLSLVRISGATVRLLQARTRCNRAAQLVRGEPIFKATTETEDAAATLPLMIADGEETFRSLINRLYKLLYESSADFSRISRDFLNRHSVLFNVKHLRTHYFHDVDHGNPSEIRSKFRRPGEIFIGLAGAPVLRDVASWRRAQLSLVTGLADALDDLEDETSRPSS